MATESASKESPISHPQKRNQRCPDNENQSDLAKLLPLNDAILPSVFPKKGGHGTPATTNETLRHKDFRNRIRKWYIVFNERCMPCFCYG